MGRSAVTALHNTETTLVLAPASIAAGLLVPCGAAPRQKCELSSGQPRTDPHRDRRLVAKDPHLSNAKRRFGG
jgi:hypothetical protein